MGRRSVSGGPRPSAVPSTCGNPPNAISTLSSMRSMPGGRPARPISRARRVKAGSASNHAQSASLDASRKLVVDRRRPTVMQALVQAALPAQSMLCRAGVTQMPRKCRRDLPRLGNWPIQQDWMAGLPVPVEPVSGRRCDTKSYDFLIVGARSGFGDIDRYARLRSGSCAAY